MTRTSSTQFQVERSKNVVRCPVTELNHETQTFAGYFFLVSLFAHQKFSCSVKSRHTHTKFGIVNTSNVFVYATRKTMNHYRHNPCQRALSKVSTTCLQRSFDAITESINDILMSRLSNLLDVQVRAKLLHFSQRFLRHDGLSCSEK